MEAILIRKPYVVGIGGGSAGGKSTFAKALAEALDGLSVEVFAMDGYFKPEAERPYPPAYVSGKHYIDDNHPLTMDLPRLCEDLRRAIESGSHDVLLVEGLLTLADEPILALLDLKLFVDCRADERIVRRLRRNQQWGLTFDEIADVYLDMVRYRHDTYVEPSRWRADLVLNGSHPSEIALSMLAEHIRTHITNRR